MKKKLFLIIGLPLFLIIIITLNKSINNTFNITNSIKTNNKDIYNTINNKNVINNNLVDIKVILNKKCSKCTTLTSYIKVYQKAGVKFGKIKQIDYTSFEGEKLLQKYSIQKLPFIIFSNNLVKYETIANSWKNTFGYINRLGEYIPSDIIPPYFDLKTQKILGLVDILYIGESNCDKCYGLYDVKKVLNTFGLRFNNIKSINKSSTIGKKLIKKYNINIFPVIILSKNLSLYKNFSYFWKSIGTIEGDKKYILRKPINLGLKFQLSGN